MTASERHRPSLAAGSPLAPASGAARRRGRLIHRLLELLPAVAPSERAGAIQLYLRRTSLGLAPPERREIAAHLMRVLGSPEMIALLGPDSLAEVPLAAEIDGVLLSGQVDRLAVTPDRVFVIDYKTGGQVPERAEDAPPAYVAQMAAYRAILARLYPDRPIACGLLYTDRPVLHWLQESVLAPFAP
jgi:ATP-dependent helicase/nuclease subunit A